MRKCDIKGCKNKAEVFGKTLAFCREHWNKITSEGVDGESEIFTMKVAIMQKTKLKRSKRQKFVELCPTCRNSFNKNLPLYHSWQTVQAALRNQRRICLTKQHQGCNVKEPF